jgi:predicted RNA methylase
MTAAQIARSALAALQPPPGSDQHVWAARITACWRASVEAILEVGRLLAAAKESLPHGQFGEMIEAELPFSPRTAERLIAIGGDPRLSNPTHVSHLPASWGTLYELTKLPDEEFARRIADGTIKPDMMRRDLVEPRRPVDEEPGPSSAPAEPFTIEHDPDEPPRAPEPVDSKLPQSPHNAQRVEDADSLDYSPTPPWATRALFEYVLPRLGVTDIASAWDPACGEGHMTSVMEEYVAGSVIGTDIHDYGCDGRAAPGWLREQDFLDEAIETPDVDWIITNPPFGERVLPFMRRALDLSEVGVAMFLQLRYLEGVDRYNAVYRNAPPTLFAPFVERVPLHMGRYEPNGSTMTAFMWLVWMKDRLPLAPFWIPPNCRAMLRRNNDDEHFTAHPVDHPLADALRPPRLIPYHDSETGEIIESEAPKSRPEAERKPSAHIETLATAKSLDQASVETDASGANEAPQQTERTQERQPDEVATQSTDNAIDGKAISPVLGAEVGEGAYPNDPASASNIIDVPEEIPAFAIDAPTSPDPGINIEIPDNLLRVELSKKELAILNRLSLDDADRDEQEFITHARKNPEAATVATRNRLAEIAKAQGITSEQAL